jgi:hypothetical protein
MATSGSTFFPILVVLQKGGGIELGRLTQELNKFRGFGDVEAVEHAIDRYTKCLIIREGFVIYNRLADRYTRIADVYERSIQAGLHANVPEMEKWQLYEYKTRDNSDKCYMQIPWSEIPEDPFFRSAKIRYQPNCNFRCNGKDTCTGRCGVKEEILDRHRMIVR